MTERQAFDMLTPREAARLIGVSTATLVRWSDAGHLPVIVLPGGRRRYRLTDIEAIARPRDHAKGAS